MRERLNDLLFLSKTQEGFLSLEREEICLKELTQTIVEAFTGSHQLQIEIQVVNKKSLCIGNQKSIKTLLKNLIENAIRYTKGVGTYVSITFQEYNDPEGTHGIQGLIKDDGKGIEPGELKNIFTPFTEGSRTQNQAGGTGLGLTICLEIVKAHEGYIKAEHNIPKGASIMFQLPIKGNIHHENPNR